MCKYFYFYFDAIKRMNFLPPSFVLNPKIVYGCNAACKAASKKFSQNYVPTNEDRYLAYVNNTSVKNIIKQRGINARNVCMLACYN
jgi:dipeptidase